jgi:hypothetical protein
VPLSEFFVAVFSEFLALPADYIRWRLGQPDVRRSVCGTIPDAEAERSLREARTTNAPSIRAWLQHCRINAKTERFVREYLAWVDARRARREAGRPDPSATTS